MRNRFALGPLDAARGLEIIRNAGKQWVTDEVASDIIEAVISSRRGEGLSSTEEEVEPAYLNVMCNELFERMVATGQTQITRELVAAEKGGILESLYERSLVGLDDSVRMFVEEHLVTPAGFRATLPVEEARREHISDADLQTLVDRRLLRFEDRLGTRHVELAHDLLTGLVEKSRKLREQAQLQQKLRQAKVEGGPLGNGGGRRNCLRGALLACLRASEYFLLCDIHAAKWRLCNDRALIQRARSFTARSR
jgi:hypothetical protein